jgi:hypothetical protein
MKTKLVLSTEKNETEQWTYLPFIPRIHDWFNVKDLLTKEEIEEIKRNSISWSGEKGKVQSVEYRHDDNEFYIEINIRCEDKSLVS